MVKVKLNLYVPLRHESVRPGNILCQITHIILRDKVSNHDLKSFLNVAEENILLIL